MWKTFLTITAFITSASTSSFRPSETPSFISNSSEPNNRANESTGIPACDALIKVGLGDRLLLPTDTGYEPQVESFWAENARLRPFCFILPQTTEEVSKALTALVNTNDGAGDWHIAVRSGGHSLTGNNIVNGVTIDLSMMNSSSYDPRTNLASIQPGGRWMNVYANLEAEGVVVAGGRDGDVGVGGFLLGGGNSFFSGRMGFGCDCVANFEVVLANGTIINANSTTNADLWRALKGGSGNLGIVTRFDMETIPSTSLYYDLRFLSYDHAEMVTDVVHDFTNQDQDLAENALVTYFGHDTTIMPGIHEVVIYVNTQGSSHVHTAFDKIKDLPCLINITRFQTMAEAAAGSQITGGERVAWSTLTFCNNPDILRYAVKLHEDLVESLKQSVGTDNFKTWIFFQPIPSYFGQIGKQRGGNMLGLDKVHENAIMWTADVAVNSTDADHAVAEAMLSQMTAKLKEFSRSAEGSLDLVFLNYANPSQDSLGSYGQENVEHMRAVAVKYDPTGVFQERVPGGFKISRVA